MAQVVQIVPRREMARFIPHNQYHGWWCHQQPCMLLNHYSDVIMDAIASQITSLTIVYSTVYSGTDQRKNQSSASLAFVWGIHRGPVNSPHKWPVTRKMFPFDDVIMTPIDLWCVCLCVMQCVLSNMIKPCPQSDSKWTWSVFFLSLTFVIRIYTCFPCPVSPLSSKIRKEKIR